MKKPILVILSIALLLLGIALLLYAWSKYIVFRVISFIVLAAAILVIALRIRAKRKNTPDEKGITGFLNAFKGMINSDKLFKIAFVTFTAAISLCICGTVLAYYNVEDSYNRDPIVKHSLESTPTTTDDLETTEPETEPDTKEITTEEVTTEEPVTEPPATEPPATEPPVTNPPVTDPPVTQPPQSPENQKTVYITKSGECYHYANPCGRGKYYASTLEEALQQGLRPCEKCILH